MIYVSADKDLCQLLEGHDRFWDPGRKRWLDVDGVTETFGVRPEQIPDLLGLAGDAVDNIPGVPGIGRKTAVTLLTALGDLEGIYADPARAEAAVGRGGARVRRLLERHRKQAWLSRQLATIDRSAAVATHGLAWTGADPAAIAGLGLPPALDRRALRLAAPRWEQPA